jgi:GntR family transcriptional regulator
MQGKNTKNRIIGIITKAKDDQMTPDPLRQGRAPLYLQVAEILRQKIARGTWQEGTLIPTLTELSEEFKVAKITVRQAVKMLEEEGLVSAKRGRGTTVIAKPEGQRPLKVETRLSELVEMYRGDEADLICLDDSEADLPGELYCGTPFSGGYHMLRRVHERDGQPYCIITLYLAKPIFSKHEAQIRQELALPILFDEADIEIKAARQSMIINRCGIETAELLNLEIGAPIAEVRRILCDSDNTIIYMADVIYRGDYIRLDMDLLA